jgi:hypothetical protein
MYVVGVVEVGSFESCSFGCFIVLCGLAPSRVKGGVRLLVLYFRWGGLFGPDTFVFDDDMGD